VYTPRWQALTTPRVAAARGLGTVSVACSMQHPPGWITSSSLLSYCPATGDPPDCEIPRRSDSYREAQECRNGGELALALPLVGGPSRLRRLGCAFIYFG